MRQFFLLLTTFSLFLVSCDTNDNNDPATPCEAHFYTIAATSVQSTGTTYEVYRYQKSDVLSSPEVLYTGNPFDPNLGGSILTRANAALNDDAGIYIYSFPGVSSQEYYKYDAAANTFERAPLASVNNPEFVSNQLRFLRFQTFMNSGVITTDLSIIDENNNVVSQVHAGLDLSQQNTGMNNVFDILSSTDRQNKLFYLANTLLFVYDTSADTWTDYSVETFDNTNNKVYYRGFEYVGNNTFYALKGDETDPNNLTLQLVKIEIAGNTVQVSVLKDLTNALSVSAQDVIGAQRRNWINSTYDACDNSYYFKVSYSNPVSTRLFEIKLESDTINESITNGKIFYGLNINP